MIDDMAVYIANLGKYNEGYLVGAWFTFPIDEEDVKEKIGLNEQYEEYAIHDLSLIHIYSIYNQIKRGDIEGVKIGAGTHKRLADVPFRITSKTTGENHVVVTDDNGQFSTSADWASHKHNTNAGKTSEDGVWFGTSEPGDSKGALPYDTYIIRCV